MNNKKDILPVFARLITVYNEHHKKTKSEEMTVEYVKKGWETIFNCLHTHYPFQHDGPIANTRMYNSSLHPELLSDFQIGCVSKFTKYIERHSPVAGPPCKSQKSAGGAIHCCLSW